MVVENEYLALKRHFEEYIDYRLNQKLEELQYYFEEKQIEIAGKSVVKEIPEGSRYRVLKRQGWKCLFCEQVLKYSKAKESYDGEVAHIDHIHPFSKRASYPFGMGNINDESNLQALCPTCNLVKKDKEIN